MAELRRARSGANSGTSERGTSSGRDVEIGLADLDLTVWRMTPRWMETRPDRQPPLTATWTILGVDGEKSSAQPCEV